MAELLAGLKGRFILSLNNVPEARETFAALTIEPVETSYTVAARGKSRGKVRELLISGGEA